MKKILLLFLFFLTLTGCGDGKKLDAVISDTDTSNVIKITNKKEAKKSEDNQLLIVYEVENIKNLRGNEDLKDMTITYQVKVKDSDKNLSADELYQKYKPDNVEGKFYILSFTKADMANTIIKENSDYRLYLLNDYDETKEYNAQKSKIQKVIDKFTK